MSLSLTPWRLVIDSAAGQIAQALVDELGPTRATTAALATGPGLVYVVIESPDRDRWGTSWISTVELSALWASGVLDGDEVRLEVEVDGLLVVTDAAGMARVAAGEDYATWRASVTSNQRLRAV